MGSCRISRLAPYFRFYLHPTRSRVPVAFFPGVTMRATSLLRGRWLLYRKIGIENVGGDLPSIVRLLFPDLHKLAAVRRGLAFRVFRRELIDAHRIGQVAGAGHVYFVGLPSQRIAGHQKSSPVCANGCLVAGYRG